MRRAVAGLLVTLVVAAGCADESSGRTGEDPTPAEKGAPAPPGVRLTSTGTIEADQVLVDWTVVNGSETGLLVADLVPPRGHLVADGTPLAAYAVSDGDRVELAQRVFTWPDTDRTWAVAPRIGVTRLRAGARLERRLAVPLPRPTTRSAGISVTGR